MSHSSYHGPYGGAGGYGGGGYGAPGGYGGGGYGGGRPDDGGCRDFKMGRCSRGAECRFAHIKEVCGDFLKGRCSRGELCKFTHDKAGGPPCRDFLKGLCTRGDACRYHHYDNGSLPPCRDFLRGKCERVSDCKYAHDVAEQQRHMAQAAAGGDVAGAGAYGSVGGYGAASSAPYGGAAPGTGYGAHSYEDQPAPRAPGVDDDSMPANAGSSRKRGRDDGEADNAEAGNEAEAAAAAPGTEGEDSATATERPAKQHRVTDDKADSNKPSTEKTAEPSALLADSTRGADGKELSGDSHIATIEGGPNVASHSAASDVAQGGGQLNAGQGSVNVSPAGAGAPSVGGAAPSGNSGSGSAPGGVSGGAGGPA